MSGLGIFQKSHSKKFQQFLKPFSRIISLVFRGILFSLGWRMLFFEVTILQKFRQVSRLSLKLYLGAEIGKNTKRSFLIIRVKNIFQMVSWSSIDSSSILVGLNHLKITQNDQNISVKKGPPFGKNSKIIPYFFTVPLV